MVRVVVLAGEVAIATGALHCAVLVLKVDRPCSKRVSLLLLSAQSKVTVRPTIVTVGPDGVAGRVGRVVTLISGA